MRITLLTAAALTLLSFTAYAQPKSLGAAFTFSGIGMTYEHLHKNEASFAQVSLTAETSELFLYRTNHPGISASFTWNFIFRKWKTSEDNEVSLFAGPGATVGYGPDFKIADGLHFGLKGRVGIECNFNRNVVISVSASPVLGAHIAFEEGYLSMKYYKNGLIYSIIPEIGIRYRF